MKYMALPLSLLLLLFSCATQEVCDDDNQSYIVAQFRTEGENEDGEKEERDTTMAEMTIYGIREGKPDSLLYNSTSMNKAQLPLDPNNDITSFVFSNAIQQDTLVLTHSSELYLISYDCGFASRFSLEQYTASGNWIKEIVLRNGEIDAALESDDEDLRIYF
jgi:hypothetical protein